jgi:hypothetical protein
MGMRYIVIDERTILHFSPHWAVPNFCAVPKHVFVSSHPASVASVSRLFDRFWHDDLSTTKFMKTC